MDDTAVKSRNMLNTTVSLLLDFDRHSNFPDALREAALVCGYQIVLMTEEFNTIMTVETRHLVRIEDAVSAARQNDMLSVTDFRRIEIESVITYWGFITIKDKKYILVLVDNNDCYSGGDIERLARAIEIASAMWKYTPERDSRGEFIRSAFRGDIAFCRTLLEEAGLRGKQFTSAFMIKGSGGDSDAVMSCLRGEIHGEGTGLLTASDEYGMFGIVYTDAGRAEGIEAKNACLRAFNSLKGIRKDERIFHVTGMETLEACVDGFKMINKTSGCMEKVFPFKRVFSKYEISMVSDCLHMRSGSTLQSRMYLNLLEPFGREVTPNKGNMLIDTLATFVLDAGMNSGRTAEFMNVHNNTVQYRLKKANEILGAEMTGNRVIPGLTMALALRRLEED